MAQFLAVANRKGGVGKSTIAVMLAHAAALWGGKRVLLLDLDSQCNATLILIGGQGWSEARKAGHTIADYFYELFDGNNPEPREYLKHNVSDLVDARGKKPRISLLPGSLLLEDVQGELFVKQARESKDPEIVGSQVRGKLERLLRRFAGSYDLVILDCPPGLSLAALAALKTADRVLVPFRPDYVSQLAVDRVAMLIEGKRTLDDVEQIPLDQRRYVCLANGVRMGTRDQVLVDEIAIAHPILATQLPMLDSIADAFDWDPRPKTIEVKYGAAAGSIRRLYEEIDQSFFRLAPAA